MAMISCKECGKDVSDKAVSCPNCGVPIALVKEPPIRRVKTSEDSALTRNRGCADIIIYGPLLIIFLAILASMVK